MFIKPFIPLIIFLSIARPVAAQGRKPEEKKPAAKQQASHPVQDAKQGANQALNELDRGIHQTGSAAKDGANQALNAVDREVHKVVGSKSSSDK